MKNKISILIVLLSFGFIACNDSVKSKKEDTNTQDIIDTTKLENIRIEDVRVEEVSQTKTKFSSNIRPNDPIVLNRTYTDTIAFLSYNDDYDYRMIEGKKNEKFVALIYNWDWQNNEKYNFKNGGFLKVEWKLDSIYSAGDGETLEFAERAIEVERIISKNNPVKFLWRADKFNEELNRTINSIIINESFVNSISNQEKAALGYVASFIGNECMWDGKINEDRSNLKCKILSALDLGYQCSESHLGFLKHWFSQDETVLKKLEVCRTIPESATVQSTFDEISIITDEDNHTIKVNYKVRSINLRESTTRSWSQTDVFEFTCEDITLVDSKKSKIINLN